MKITCLHLGKAPYRETYDLQKRLVEHVGLHPDDAYMIFVEHSPQVITKGRRTEDANIVAPTEMLKRMGVDVVEIERGGDVTWHGPGQLVAYPIFRLQAKKQPLHAYVAALEEAIIDTLDELGIESYRSEGKTGVWTDSGKIAAIGVAAARRVVWHGLALNVTTDMQGFSLIVPCGLVGNTVTSIERLLPECPAMESVESILARHLCPLLEFDSVEHVEADTTFKPEAETEVEQEIQTK